MREKRSIGIRYDAELEIHSECKYRCLPESDDIRRVEYRDVEFIEIVSGEDAKDIEAQSDGSCIDDFHEYLVLHFADGSELTFRNSYVDMFRTRYSYRRKETA